MNTQIMAERQALAIQAIAGEVGRLGGELIVPSVRASTPAARQVILLEAIASALEAIAAPESEPAGEQPAPKAKRQKGGL